MQLSGKITETYLPKRGSYRPREVVVDTKDGLIPFFVNDYGATFHFYGCKVGDHVTVEFDIMSKVVSGRRYPVLVCKGINKIEQ